MKKLIDNIYETLPRVEQKAATAATPGDAKEEKLVRLNVYCKNVFTLFVLANEGDFVAELSEQTCHDPRFFSAATAAAPVEEDLSPIFTAIILNNPAYLEELIKNYHSLSCVIPTRYDGLFDLVSGETPLMTATRLKRRMY